MEEEVEEEVEEKKDVRNWMGGGNLSKGRNLSTFLIHQRSIANSAMTSHRLLERR